MPKSRRRPASHQRAHEAKRDSDIKRRVAALRQSNDHQTLACRAAIRAWYYQAREILPHHERTRLHTAFAALNGAEPDSPILPATPLIQAADYLHRHQKQVQVIVATYPNTSQDDLDMLLNAPHMDFISTGTSAVAFLTEPALLFLLNQLRQQQPAMTCATDLADSLFSMNYPDAAAAATVAEHLLAETARTYRWLGGPEVDLQGPSSSRSQMLILDYLMSTSVLSPTDLALGAACLMHHCVVLMGTAGTAADQ